MKTRFHADQMIIMGLTGELHILHNGTMWVEIYGRNDLRFPIEIEDVVAWVKEHEVEEETA